MFPYELQNNNNNKHTKKYFECSQADKVWHQNDIKVYN